MAWVRRRGARADHNRLNIVAHAKCGSPACRMAGEVNSRGMPWWGSMAQCLPGSPRDAVRHPLAC